MAADNPRGAMFRVIVPNQHSRVTNVELFFDLVFVFAVTQVSHTLLHHFTPLGAVHVTVLFLAVWWVWVYTAWVTNWLNPELTPVRVLLFADDAGRPRAVDHDPDRLRRAGPVVRDRLRDDAGRAHRVLAVRNAAAPGQRSATTRSAS